MGDRLWAVAGGALAAFATLAQIEVSQLVLMVGALGTLYACAIVGADRFRWFGLLCALSIVCACDAHPALGAALLSFMMTC